MAWLVLAAIILLHSLVEYPLVVRALSVWR
jgi:hypothetical protein